MMKNFFGAMAIVAITGFLNTGAMAQQDKEKSKIGDNDEIVIIRKGNKDTKVTVEIKDGEVTVNGKPLSEFNDNDVMVRKMKANQMARAFVSPGSPFRGGGTYYNNNSDIFTLNSNKAFLGVMSEKADDGVKITKVTKGSAAEKGGLKENDIITRVDETVIISPEDLSKAIGKFKPEDKTVVYYKRDKKEQKTTISLGKRDDGIVFPNQDIDRNFKLDLNNNFDFDMSRSRVDGLGIIRGGSPRLGIKAQDTEEGKGVKVLDVDDASNAEKAGVKEGDIITEFDGKPVNSAIELADAAKDAKDKSPIKIKLNRNGKSQELEVKIPKKLRTANL